MKLLDATKLAKELGVSTWITYASKRAAAHYGDSPWVGRYTTVERFEAWLGRHPEFVASHFMRSPIASNVSIAFSRGRVCVPPMR